jgi:dihydrolipoamide dehydrogenase
MSERYDVIVIGAGPAGYIAAIRAAQLGFKVACVEKWKTPSGELALGGTCLNVGCIPSKALLASSEEYENAAHHLHEHGIEVQGVKVDVAKMVARKDGIVSKMTKGIEFLFRKNKITWLKGHGRFVGAADGFYKIEVRATPQRVNEARNVIIATGSKSRHLPGMHGRQRGCLRQRRRAGFQRGAQAAGRDRGRRDRPGVGLGLAPARGRR